MSVKNLELATPFCEEITRQYGIDPHRPIVCQVSRFDPWKDPVGVIEAFRIVREQVPDAQLLLAGSMATDDPEGFRVWETTEAAAAATATSTCCRTCTRSARSRSTRSSGSPKSSCRSRSAKASGSLSAKVSGRAGPWSADARAGSACRSATGSTAFSSTTSSRAAHRIIDLLADPTGADEMGLAGKEYVRENFLSTRELEDWLGLFGELKV